MKLPRSIQYKIISHPRLQIINEDSLFDIIYKIVNRGYETEEYEDILFIEQIEFTSLSEPKLCEFINSLNLNQITSTLWQKLVECFSSKIENYNEKLPSTNEKNRYAQIVYVGGYNGEMQLGVSSNNESEDGSQIVCPPLKSFKDCSSFLSYSIYYDHSVVVLKNGTIMAVGDNTKGQICSSLPKEIIREFTEFFVVNYILNPISAVCYRSGTVYMFSNTQNKIVLALCESEINEGSPILLDIGDQQPVALY